MLVALTAASAKQRDALDALTAEVTTAQKNKADGSASSMLQTACVRARLCACVRACVRVCVCACVRAWCSANISAARIPR